jgi:hypothetical protein
VGSGGPRSGSGAEGGGGGRKVDMCGGGNGNESSRGRAVGCCALRRLFEG